MGIRVMDLTGFDVWHAHHPDLRGRLRRWTTGTGDVVALEPSNTSCLAPLCFIPQTLYAFALYPGLHLGG